MELHPSNYLNLSSLANRYHTQCGCLSLFFC